MFICNTMESPNSEQIIECVAKSVHYALTIHAHEICGGSVTMEIFDERKYPLGRHKRNFSVLPKVEEITNFLKFLFFKQSLSPHVGVMAIHYVDQLINRKGLLVTPATWRRVLLCALLVADKMWEEDIVCNSDYCNDSFPNLTVGDINRLEREFLSALDFKLVLKASVYAEYYFALRSIDGMENFPSKPLNKETAQKLAINGTIDKNFEKFKFRRSKSVGWSKKEKLSPIEKISVSLEQFSQRLGSSFCKIC